MPYTSPLIGYENAPPLPTTINADGKSLTNLPNAEGKLSSAYDEFVDPLNKKDRNGFDFHSKQFMLSYVPNIHTNYVPVYYMQAVPEQAQFAKELHERIRREFPEVRVEAEASI